jgi:integrase
MGRIPDNDGVHKRRGVWYYRLRIDGRLRELSTRTTNYQEARRVRQDAIEAHRKGQLPTDLARAPFDRVAEDWLAGRKVRVSPKTYSSDRERMRPLQKAFGGYRLEELVANGGALIRTYQLRRSKYVRACNMELTIIRQILKQARLWRRVEDDVKSLPERSRGPGRALTADEESRLWTTASGKPDWQVPYLCGVLAANTTMRGCEIKGLRLQDVDLDARLLNIRRTKTDGGIRMIPLNTTAHWALSQLVARARRLGSKLPDHFLLPRRLVTLVHDPNQHQLSWRSAWRRLTKAAGLGGLRFHDLRHHSITRLAEAGVPEQTLMAIAGHVSRKMLEHYSHIRVQAKRDAVSLLTSTWTGDGSVTAAEVMRGELE